jgi:plastocyanin
MAMKDRVLTLFLISVIALALIVNASAAEPNASPQDTVIVEVSNFVFIPEEVTISVGDTVQWENVEGFHNVVADNGSFTSGPPASGAWTYSFTFTTPGTYPYYCEVHGGPGGVGMSGVIIVTGSTPTATSTATPTATSTSTQTPTSSPASTQTPTATPSATPTSTHTPAPTSTTTQTPTITATATGTPTSSPSPSPTATGTPVLDEFLFLPVVLRS